MTSVLWLRRDLRRHDHPALLAAAADGRVAPLVVIDPRLWAAAGPVRRAWYAASVRAAAGAYGGRLSVRLGDPRVVVPAFASGVGAGSVHVSRESTPAGSRRDAAVAALLTAAGVRWVETGTPYAVGPGLVTKADGTAYQVFTPFRRAWAAHGWPAPAGEPERLEFVDGGAQGAAAALDADAGRAAEAALDAALAEPGLPHLPEVGEEAALTRWRAFLDGGLAAYGTDRDRADLDATSGLSPYLKVGAIHPRTLLADLAERRGAVPGEGESLERFVSELAWREFYADVLWRHPGSAWRDLKPALAGLRYDAPEDAIAAWQAGQTGYPIVDAGMRQLRATGWMHNRVRMITASFLTKDLHVWWPVGARFFLDHLIDGDLASNSHGWQWVAGTGTDASPYVRVFNPVTQGRRFDPRGEYVRRWVPELRHVGGAAVHEPWEVPDGYAAGYPARLVDHAAERAEALRRFAAARSRPPAPPAPPAHSR